MQCGNLEFSHCIGSCKILKTIFTLKTANLYFTMTFLPLTIYKPLVGRATCWPLRVK